VKSGVDSPLAASGKGNKGRWRARRLGASVGFLLTGLAERFVEESGEGFGLCGASATRLIGLAGHLGGDAVIVGPPNMDDAADQHESDQQELVQQQVRRHDVVLIHGDERGQFYRIRPLPNYPLHEGTQPSGGASRGTPGPRGARGSARRRRDGTSAAWGAKPQARRTPRRLCTSAVGGGARRPPDASPGPSALAALRRPASVAARRGARARGWHGRTRVGQASWPCG
jgi:hypothetical protein